MKEKLEDAGMDNADAYESDDEILQRVSGITIRRLITMIGAINMTKEEMLDINHRLNGIRKKERR